MKTKVFLVVVAALLQTPNIVARTSGSNHTPVALIRSAVVSQATNPPYLSQMPTVERVKAEIRGTDAMDTALRQAGAFEQLQRVISDLALSRGLDRLGRRQFTPDEVRLSGEYFTANYDALQPYAHIANSPSHPDKTKYYRLHSFYGTDPGFLDEVFTRTASPLVRAEYAKANAAFAARHEEVVRERKEEQAQAQAARANAQGTALPPTDDPGTLAARRCIAAGRDPFECMKEALGKTLGEIVPGAKKTSQPSGLRLNGVYPGSGGFGLVFGPGAVAVTCGALVPEGHPYTAAMNGNQVLITMQNNPKPIVIAVRPDGKLVGPGPTDIKGQVVVGTKTEQRSTRTVDGRYETHYVTVNVYAPKIERCNIGVLASTGAASPVGLDDALGTKIFDATARQMANSEEIKATPGLRMTGVYAGQRGFSIEFHNESAVVECRDAVVARVYTVDNTGTRVTIQNSSNPIVLALRPDGTLAGSGPIQVAGRVVVGMSSDNQVLYAPKTDTCTLGILTPASAGSASTTTPGEADGEPASTPPNIPAASGPSRTGSASAPKPSGAAGSAVLTITLGIPNRPGQALLPGQIFLLLNENFETALKQQGFEPMPGVSILKSAGACNAATPNCQKVGAAIKAHSVGMVRIDPEGKVNFAGVAAGTYFLVSRVEYPAYSGRVLLFNLRVDLKPGANSVTVDQQNATH